MKKLLLLTLLFISQLNLQAVVAVQDWTVDFKDQTAVQALTPDMTQVSLDKFLAMSPKDYRKATGKRLGLKKSLQLKAAQKAIKKSMKKGGGDIPKGLYILLALLGGAWIAMGIMDDWDGSDWIINLVLYILCWLPGLIHAFVKMKNYY